MDFAMRNFFFFLRKLPWNQKLNNLCRRPLPRERSSTPLIARVPLGGFVMLQSLRTLVHVYMRASSWGFSVKVVMDADPRGSASGEICKLRFLALSGELVGGSRADGCHSMGSEWHMPGLGSLRIPLRSYQSAGLTGRGSRNGANRAHAIPSTRRAAWGGLRRREGAAHTCHQTPPGGGSGDEPATSDALRAVIFLEF